jgi:hypothetical protein
MSIDAGVVLGAESQLSYLLAGSATATIRNSRTGNRFTYRVRRPDDESPWFVSLLTGPDNGEDYQHVATIFFDEERASGRGGSGRYHLFGGYSFVPAKRFRGRGTPDSVLGFGWVLRRLLGGEELPEHVELWHDGTCGRCGRELTVPESIASGLGPVCRSKSAA